MTTMPTDIVTGQINRGLAARIASRTGG